MAESEPDQGRQPAEISRQQSDRTKHGHDDLEPVRRVVDNPARDAAENV